MVKQQLDQHFMLGHHRLGRAVLIAHPQHAPAPVDDKRELSPAAPARLAAKRRPDRIRCSSRVSAVKSPQQLHAAPLRLFQLAAQQGGFLPPYIDYNFLLGQIQLAGERTKHVAVPFNIVK
ncbi:hypothetical protein D3C76_1419760 [compost metagenome]